MSCIFCGGNDITAASYPRPTRFEGKIFSYRQCRSCKLIFIEPLPTAEDYDKMYANSYHEEFYFKETDNNYSQLFNLLNPLMKNRFILDYGCGDGSFLRFLSKRGYKCAGVEYDSGLVQKLREQNRDIQFYTVDEFWSEQNDISFWLIFFGDVLEHLATPVEFLRKIYQKMPTGGLIVAQGPLENNSSLNLLFRKMTSSLIGKDRIASHTPYHIFFSNAKNQEMLFSNTGFKTIYYKVEESPWPCPSQFSAQPVKAVQFVVGQASILFSKLLPLKMGNRFIYIGRK